jgi:hypothetical protein
MYSKGIIRGYYLPVETVARQCRWEEIARQFGGGKIKRELRRLASSGLVTLHGKGTVVSLTHDGTLFANDYIHDLELKGESLW